MCGGREEQLGIFGLEWYVEEEDEQIWLEKSEFIFVAVEDVERASTSFCGKQPFHIRLHASRGSLTSATPPSNFYALRKRLELSCNFFPQANNQFSLSR